MKRHAGEENSGNADQNKRMRIRKICGIVKKIRDKSDVRNFANMIKYRCFEEGRKEISWI